MDTALVPSPPQTRSEYGIGASSAAAAIGLSDYSSRLDAWLEATGRVASFAGNERTKWGQVLEPVIRAHYVERNRVAVHVPPMSLYHKELGFVRATPDGIVLDPCDESWAWVGPQVKNVGLRMAPAWADSAIPNDYVIQGIVEMAVADLPRIDFAVLIGGQEYREPTQWRDAELEADVLGELEAFWKLVESNTQPEIDASKKFRSHMLAQIKRRAVVEASPTDIAMLEAWKSIVIDMKRLERAEKTIKNRVLAEMAARNGNVLQSPLGNVTVGVPRRKTAWKDVSNELAQLLPTMQMFERELLALRADVGDDADAGLLQRIDGLREQLRLVGGLHTYVDVVARHTTVGEPSVNRPRSWTKDIDDENKED